MAHDARWIPREVQITFALNQLLERVGQRFWLAAAYQLLRQHARGVRQCVVGTRLNGFNGGAHVEIIQSGTG